MNEQQTKERLAEFMGWEKKNVMFKNGTTECFIGNNDVRPCSLWNPLTDWNHWRQVEEKVMEDEELVYKFIRDFATTDIYMKADLPTRCKALVAVLSNSPSSDDSN